MPYAYLRAWILALCLFEDEFPTLTPRISLFQNKHIKGLGFITICLSVGPDCKRIHVLIYEADARRGNIQLENPCQHCDISGPFAL